MNKIFLILCIFLCVQPLDAHTWTVTNTADSGLGSLRNAVTSANADTDALVIIDFNISPTGILHTITPTTMAITNTASRSFIFPPITRTMTIDATTQPGYSFTTPMIEIDCSMTFTRGICLGIIGTDNCAIKGLVIDNYTMSDGNGIEIMNTSAKGASGNQITQCQLGSFSLSQHPFGNTRSIVLDGGDSMIFPINNTIIGGPNITDGNVLSGNSIAGFQAEFNVHNTIIQNNKIGCDIAGTIPQSNAYGIVFIGDTNLPCNNSIITDNVISGNTVFGIIFQWNVNNATIRNNKCGTDITGSIALGNTPYGIVITGNTGLPCTNNSIGGYPAQGNIISGNQIGIAFQDEVNNNIIQGNLIGTDITGSLPIPNNYGIEILGDPGLPCTGNLIGSTNPIYKNIIAFNSNNGILIDGASATLNAILGNSIFLNNDDGIQLTNNGNNAQQGPSLISARDCHGLRIVGRAPELPAGSYFRLEFFITDTDNGTTEGQTLIGVIPSIASGRKFNHLFMVPIFSGALISATATNLNNNGNPGDTSEFTPFIHVV